MTSRVYIIAEAGVNHNGDVAIAHQLIDAAFEAGADAVKFQAFKAHALVNESAPKAQYQQDTTGASESQFAMLKKLELAEDDFHALASRCAELGIEFVCTPFDHESLDFLHRELKVKRIKVSSGDLTNGPLLARIGATRLPAILSTGMSGLADVETALGALACGYLGAIPTEAGRVAAFASVEGQAVLHEKVTLLHCTTEYPAPIDEVNLRAMDALRGAFQLDVGYSDHTPGIVIPVAAAARGATMLEKHFTLDKTLPGPDHRASLEPPELRVMVEQVRIVSHALGSGVKTLTTSEAKNMEVARKSVVAVRPIKAGDVFGHENLGIKRPGTGTSPMRYWDLLGRAAVRSYAQDDVIDE